MAGKTKKGSQAAKDGPEGLWALESTGSDYAAAADYLSLSLAPASATSLADALLRAPLVTRRAADILRASGLDLLDRADASVARVLKAAKRGDRLAPVLLVRGDLRSGRALVVADGYARICAGFHTDEDAGIPCRIADLPTSPGAPAAKKAPAKKAPAAAAPAATAQAAADG